MSDSYSMEFFESGSCTSSATPAPTPAVPPPSSCPGNRIYLQALLNGFVAFMAMQLILSLCQKFLPSPCPALTFLFSILPLNGAATAAFLLTLKIQSSNHSWEQRLQWSTPAPAALPRMPFALLLLLLVLSSASTALLTHLLAEALELPHDEQAMVIQFLRQSSQPLLILMTVTAVLLAPVTEELLFRLGLYQALSIGLTPRWSSLVTALFFALAHGQLITVPPLMVVGLFLQWARRQGGLRRSIALHGAYNALQVALIFAAK